MGFLHWSLTIAIAAACTVATSAVVIYTTQYLIKDHHNTLKKNQFKQKLRQMKLQLKSVETEFNNLPKPSRIEKKLLELDERLLRMLEKLDSFSIKLDPTVDLKTLKWMEGHRDALHTQKRELILRIQESHKLLDETRLKMKLPDLLNSDDSSCSERSINTN